LEIKFLEEIYFFRITISRILGEEGQNTSFNMSVKEERILGGSLLEVYYVWKLAVENFPGREKYG